MLSGVDIGDHDEARNVADDGIRGVCCKAHGEKVVEEIALRWLHVYQPAGRTFQINLVVSVCNILKY